MVIEREKERERERERKREREHNILIHVNRSKHAYVRKANKCFAAYSIDLLGASKSSSRASTLLWNSKFASVCVKSRYVERSGFM
jgi:hypothetical protein